MLLFVLQPTTYSRFAITKWLKYYAQCESMKQVHSYFVTHTTGSATASVDAIQYNFAFIPSPFDHEITFS